MKYLPYFLYLLLLACYEVILKDVATDIGFSINLGAFMVLAVALYQTELASLWFGFLAGLTIAAGQPEMIGWQAISLAGLGLAAFHISRRLNLDSLSAKLLLILGGVLLHNIITVALVSLEGFWTMFVSPVITGALYTELLAIAYFVVKRGDINPKKIKAIF